MLLNSEIGVPMTFRSTGKIVIAPETEVVGIPVHSFSELSDHSEHILFAPSLDCAVASKIVNTPSIGAVVVATSVYSDHARKMLHESGVGLVVYDGERLDKTSRCIVDKMGLTILNESVPISAICSVLNQRNLATYRRFGVNTLGYFRFKFCLFQLFSQEPESFSKPERIEAYLYEQLAELGRQHWSSIRCVLSDLTSAEFAEIGLDVAVEVNPDMGVRGPRFMKQWGPELAAIRRFQEQFDITIKICAPFISSVDEYCAFVGMVERAGIDRSRVELGFTLEVPALAEELDDLFTTAQVDFMAIGTSDLFSLFNGVCRNNQALSVLPSSKANIRLLRRVVTCAHKHGVHTFVCGEVRRNEALMSELLLVGVGELICSTRINEIISVFRLSGADRSAT